MGATSLNEINSIKHYSKLISIEHAGMDLLFHNDHLENCIFCHKVAVLDEDVVYLSTVYILLHINFPMSLNEAK